MIEFWKTTFKPTSDFTTTCHFGAVKGEEITQRGEKSKRKSYREKKKINAYKLRGHLKQN